MIINLREIERNFERTIPWLPPMCAPNGNQTHNLGICQDQQLKPQSFDTWASAPTNSAYWPGLEALCLFVCGFL